MTAQTLYQGKQLLAALRSRRAALERELGLACQCLSGAPWCASRAEALQRQSFATKTKASAPPPMSEEDRQRWVQSQRKLAADRAGYAQTLHNLRKRWAAETSAREAAKAAKETEKRQHIAAAKAVREAKRAAQREQRLQQLAALGAREEAIKAQQLAEAASYRDAMQRVYAELHDNRRKWLLEQSRNWIRAEQLDARIEIALDNPEKLFVGGAPS